MFLPMFAGCAAVVLLLLIFTIKLKKARGLFAVLMLLSLLPTALIGTIAFGRGDLVNYPGKPKQAIIGLFGDLPAYDPVHSTHVLGSLGFEKEEHRIETTALTDTLTRQLDYRLSGQTALTAFTGKHTVTVTHMDMEAWFADLPGAVEAALQNLVQTEPKETVFNAEGTAYASDIPQRAFYDGFCSHLEKAGQYLTETTLDVTLSYTPWGWLVVPDAALVNALAGCTATEETGYVLMADIAGALEALIDNADSEITGELPLLKKIYTIDENALMGQAPDAAAFGSTTDPNEVLEVIARAEPLLAGQTMSWSPDLKLKPDSEIQYYLDDSILAIVWQEVHDNTVSTFSEVKVAHPSQMRRTLSGDAFSGFYDGLNWETPTAMAKRSNAVVALSGDFYRFRQIGTVVYQRQVYRDECDMLDTCFITEDGQWLFKRRKEMKPEEVQPFVEENNVLYTLSFGPVLIENGEKIQPGTYGLGEAYEDYDRCAIGKIDENHYLLLTVTREGRYNRAGWLTHAIDYMADKNCQQAYALDGGRSASLVFNGELVNNVNYGGEREMSDIIYFASSIPESER